MQVDNKTINFLSSSEITGSEGWTDYLIKRVISGEPKARIKILRTKGSRTPIQVVSLISAEPSRFHYKFHFDEAFQIYSGHISIIFESGDVYEMFPGDMLAVSGGQDAVFEIHKSSIKFVVVTGAGKT